MAETAGPGTRQLTPSAPGKLAIFMQSVHMLCVYCVQAISLHADGIPLYAEFGCTTLHCSIVGDCMSVMLLPGF